MAEVWLTNPNLPEGQDIKVPRAALGNYAQSGWHEREDQADPIDPDTLPDEPAVEEPAAMHDDAGTSDDVPTEESPDAEPVADEPVTSTSTTTKKGR